MTTRFNPHITGEQFAKLSEAEQNQWYRDLVHHWFMLDAAKQQRDLQRDYDDERNGDWTR